MIYFLMFAFLIIFLLIIGYFRYQDKVSLIPYIIFACYILMVMFITFFPMANYGMKSLDIMPDYINLLPFMGDKGIVQDKDLVQCIQNAIMFMPLGVLYPLTFKKQINVKQFICICFLISLSIETIQLVSTFLGVMWRAFDVNDLIFNTLGGTFTYAFVVLIKRCIQIEKRQVEHLPQNSNSI